MLRNQAATPQPFGVMTVATESHPGGATIDVAALSKDIASHHGLKKTLLPLWWERVFENESPEMEASILDLNAMLRALLRAWRFKALDLDKESDKDLFHSLADAIGVKLDEISVEPGSEDERRLTQLSHLIRELHFEYKFDKYAFSTLVELLGRLDQVVHGVEELPLGAAELDARYAKKLEEIAARAVQPMRLMGLMRALRPKDVLKACEISRYYLGRVIEYDIAGKAMSEAEWSFLRGVEGSLSTIVSNAAAGGDSELMLRACDNISARLAEITDRFSKVPPHDQEEVRSMP